ncbi:hypothetical protein E1293_31805 [Actinomadura darangshiensis]|uniref:Nucleoside phosphorylase domain-containing protein n=1 Tax=Actinomadura darangshiensis TaxID=705336 RepID=A0A4R5ANT1_9ACTN|nr:hypothetical protein [Actinomadura darangshiensis]TDD73286.1 hypothetical protein E1293_31805 [Actinomadura darangshiensis]
MASRVPTNDDGVILLELLRHFGRGDPDLTELIFSDLFWSAIRLEDTQRNRILARAAVLMQYGRNDREIRDGAYAAVGDPMRPEGKRKADLLVVTVKAPELDGARAAFGIAQDAPPDHSARGAGFWHVRRETPTRSLDIVVTMNGLSTNADMAAFLSTVFAEYDVRLCVLLGMAAGREDQVVLGDVVIADRVKDFGRKVLRPEGDELEPRVFHPDRAIVRTNSNIQPQRMGWHELVQTRLREAMEADIPGLRFPAALDPAEFEPAFHRGTVLASDQLVEDGRLSDHAAQAGERRKPIAAEMEAAGFATVCEENSVLWLVIRGIADFGQPVRSKEWQFVASLSAATALVLWIDRSTYLADGKST